jgi:hypothetical protein
MDEFDTLNEIIDTTVKNSSYVSVIISSSVFILYTIIVKIVEYFKAKDKNKPILEMTSAIKEIGNNVVKLNVALDKIFQDNYKKETIKCKNTIETSFICFQNRIENVCRDIILHNNIEVNKELIYSNISQTVNTEYYKLVSILSLYEVHDTQVSSFLKEKWIQDTANSVVNIVYNGQSEHDRVLQLSNKLSIIVNNYMTYIYNKAFN